MLRDVSSLRFLRRGLQKNASQEEGENASQNMSESSSTVAAAAPGRAPLCPISEPGQKSENSTAHRKFDTPSKQHKGAKGLAKADSLDMTPEKQGLNFINRNRFGWVKRQEPPVSAVSTGRKSPLPKDTVRNEHKSIAFGPKALTYGGAAESYSVDGGSMPQTNNNKAHANSSSAHATPRSMRTTGRTQSYQSDACSSTTSTPTKSVSRPGSANTSSNNNYRVPSSQIIPSGRSKTSSIVSVAPSIVNTADVSHFDLREDPSFWMDHNVQVLVRIRPLNNAEIASQGYNRCLRQESNNSVTWMGPPETRFTFDHVACETITQEMLFKVAGLPMVENCMSGYNSCMFAYGQTGSGKTHTMLGDIEELDQRPSDNRGMTPRIFEYLFARIQAEEESRQQERMRYVCKCSFLEIYNEQITDLLEPSSNNLQLREDSRRGGVYVESLTEMEVKSVHDVLQLLILGAANRRVAATNMNRESSRSHSVFTCVIESHWEKDSMNNIRYGRLHLVDLAGSERQKTSGAEGERLKEAANINKSLSTLGLVIMILVDVAHGKQRHIPYRDSRLTFLLQDSLGGNSKTTIIANISPSICSANETLSTLKFAQRAKHIQNNAIINEDASGDVMTLQRQILQLKEELSFFKRQNVSRSLSFRSSIYPEIKQISGSEDRLSIIPMDSSEHCNSPLQFMHSKSSPDVEKSFNKKLKSVEAALAGSLRREQVAESTTRKLEAETEQLNRLVHQREEESQCNKMMMRFREDKIKRLEALTNGLLTSEEYLLEEKSALSEELQLLRGRFDRNPEVTRFALENIKLLEQLRRYQDFFEGGEREILLSEISDLRDQLVEALDAKVQPENAAIALSISKMESKNKELDECKAHLTASLEANDKLNRELENLQSRVRELEGLCNQQDVQLASSKEDKFHRQAEDTEASSMNVMYEFQERTDREHELALKHCEEIMQLQMQLKSVEAVLEEENSRRKNAEDNAACLSLELEVASKKCLELKEDLEVALSKIDEEKTVINALESQQLFFIKEMDGLQEANQELLEQLHIKEEKKRKMVSKKSHSEGQCEDSSMHDKLEKMHEALEKARRLNTMLRDEQASHREETEQVQRQVEAETAEVIITLQEELLELREQVDATADRESETREKLELLQLQVTELQSRLDTITEENEELNLQLDQWEQASAEIAIYLNEGDQSLDDATEQMNTLIDLFPQRNHCSSSNKIDKVMAVFAEKEKAIHYLQRQLEIAKKSAFDTEEKIQSLQEATIAVTDMQKQEIDEMVKERAQIKSEIMEKDSSIEEMNKIVEFHQRDLEEVSKRSLVAFVVLNNRLDALVTRMQEKDDRIAQLETDLELSSWKEDSILDLSNENFTMNKKVDHLNGDLLSMSKERDGLIRALHSEQIKVEGLMKKLTSKEEELKEMEEDAESLWRETFEATIVLHLSLGSLEIDEGKMEAAGKYEDKDNLPIQGILVLDCFAVEMQQRYKAATSELQEKDAHLRNTSTRLDKAEAALHDKEKSIVDMMKAFQALEVTRNEMELHKRQLIADVEKTTLTCLEKEIEFQIVKQALVDILVKLEDVQTRLDESSKELMVLQDERSTLLASMESQNCGWDIERLHFQLEIKRLEDQFISKKLVDAELAEMQYKFESKEKELYESQRTIEELLVEKHIREEEKDSLLKNEADATQRISKKDEELSSLQEILADLRNKLQAADDNLIILSTLVDEFKDSEEHHNLEKQELELEVAILYAELVSKVEEFNIFHLEALPKSSLQEELQKMEAETQLLRESLSEKAEMILSLRKELETSKSHVDYINNLEQQVMSKETEARLMQQETAKMVKAMEEKMKESEDNWRKEKEMLSLEVDNYKLTAAEKAAEAAILHKQFRDSEAVIKEADLTLNALLEANKNAKSDTERWKNSEQELTIERCTLINEIHRAKVCFAEKEQLILAMKEQNEAILIEAKEMVSSIAEYASNTITTLEDEFSHLHYTIRQLKSDVLQSLNMPRLWVDEILSIVAENDIVSFVTHTCQNEAFMEQLQRSDGSNKVLQDSLLHSKKNTYQLEQRLIMLRSEIGTYLSHLKVSIESNLVNFEEEKYLLANRFQERISSIKAPDNPMLMPAAEMDSQLVALASEVEENLPVVLKFADRISNLSVEKEELRKELEKSHEKNKQLQNEMDVLYEQFNESSNMVTILEGQHQSLRLSLCDEIQSLGKQLEECNFRYNETQEKKVQLENECKQYRSFISEIDVDQNAEEAFQSVKCGKNFGRQLEALKGGISYLKMAKQTLSREIDDKDSQIASLHEEIEEHAERQVSLRESLQFLERENQNLSLEFEEGFIKMQAFEMEKLMLWQKLDESYEISVEANMMSNRKDEEVTILQMQLGASNTCILTLQQENKEIQDRANYLEHSLQNQQSYIEKQNTELDKHQDTISKTLEELNLKCQQNQDLLVKLDTMQMENMELRRNILKEEEAKESLILDLQQCNSDLEEVQMENAALKEKDTGLMLLDSENQSLRERVEEVNSANKSLNETISKLGEHLSEIVEQLASKDDSLNSLRNSILQGTEDSSRYIEAVDSLDSRLSRVQEKISKGISLEDVEDSSLNMIENILEYLTILEEKVHSSLVHAKEVETNCKELSSQNSELRTELQRKDELLKGLEFDFSLLQESSTKAKDQKDEAQAVAAALRSVQEDLLAKCMGLEKELVMKETELSRMTSEVDLLRKDVSLFSERNSELEDEVEDLIAKKNFLDEELEEKQKSIDGLEEELLEMNSLVDHKTFASIESLKCELNSITRDRDRLHAEVLALNEQLEMVQAFADEREAIAVEARQVAETRKAYAEEKEEAVKILERCIEELEPTVTALETQLEMVRGEAERQRIRKEEVKAEAEALRHQLTTMQEYMTSPKARFTEYDRPKGEKVDLQEALAQMRSLKMLAEEKDEEIKKCKNHIMELTVIAEEQAKEYQNKYKALEAMANQSKGEPNTDSLASATIMSSSLATNNKSTDKATARSRGSSSPFKCIGLGLTQQMNSEKEEELYALRRRCEELEDLVDAKQQEIFKLNTRLATAESMTHDLVRDLLGVKLDISHSMVNNQQFIKVVEKARRQNEESQGREIEVQKLKARLNELIEERESWLDEINRRQAEMVTARVAAEKLRQRDQFLSTENEMLKADTATQKRRMVALEEEVKKLSGQQNLQQRIHHHAKIKEENNLLRAQHEELLGSLRRTEGHLQRIKDELAKYRTAQGKKPFIDVDEEERLRKLLQETEEEKLQFAHKLVGLCSTIFQVAGVSRPSSEIEPSMAIETVQQLKDKLECTERELQDSKLKTKIANEKTRLSELKQFSSPARSANSFTTVQNTCPSPGNMRMR